MRTSSRKPREPSTASVGQSYRPVMITLLVRNEGVYVLKDGKPIHGPVSAYEAGRLLVQEKRKQ
jgi:hypothetical protein